AYLANGYDATALQTLSEWLESGDVQKIRVVAQLLRGAPPSFVFDDEHFIEQLFNLADQIDKDLSLRINTALLSSALPFGYVVSVIPGQPSSEHIQIRDRAQLAADKFPSGSAI